MSNRFTYIIMGLLLFLMFGLTFLSIIDDSFICDEPPHIVAGYSYLTQKEMRLNPEHPPLIKDLAAIPLLFLNLNFPKNDPNWVQEEPPQWWFQFNLGGKFLFHSENNPDQILIWSRIPMILILILLGLYIFKWTKELFGNKASLLALFLFSFSPTFLAHGRLVTTDVGAAAGVFIATYYFIKALKESGKRNIILAGISFGLAELCKFTVIILIPFFILLALVWWLLKKGKLKQILKTLIFIFVIGYLLIWPVYLYHIWNYSSDRQARDIKFLLSSHPFQFLGPTLSRMAENPILRPYAEYLLGLSMVYQRGIGGNTTYFLGEISAAGWKNYFPVIYSIKEPLPLHILTIIALLSLAWLIKKPFWQNSFSRFKNWISSHFVEFSMIVFVIIYWTFSLISNLNIGVRHLLPVFPFTFILVSAGIINLLKGPYLRLKYALLGLLILWQVISVISIYPHFLAYFNELGGGPDKGYIYTVDSNLDWGQDLKRLKKFVEENEIAKIKVDYFGGGDVKYYLGDRWEEFDPKSGPQKGWLAISATFLQGGRGNPAPGFNESTGFYNWLNEYQPYARAGKSIFIYFIP